MMIKLYSKVELILYYLKQFISEATLIQFGW